MKRTDEDNSAQARDRERQCAHLGLRKVELDQLGLFGWDETTLEWKTSTVAVADW